MLANQLFIVLSPGSHFKEKVTLKLLILAHKMGNYNESFFFKLQLKNSPPPPMKLASFALVVGTLFLPCRIWDGGAFHSASEHDPGT